MLVATSAPITTGNPSGKATNSGAMRACIPASGPYSSTIRSEKPLITFVVSADPGAALTWRLRPRSVTGDAAYGTRENITAIEKASIRAYTALPEQGGRTGLFTIEDFSYDAERDHYTCPAGEVLRRQGFDRRGGYVR
jgi:hypothetical protein